MDNINFTGGFLVYKPNERAWNNVVANILPHKNVPFDRFNECGDKFVAIKSCYDKEFGLDLIKRKLKFLYYPNINLKSGLDPMYPEKAKEILSNEITIDSTYKFKKYIKEKFPEEKHHIKKYKCKPEDHVDKTLKYIDRDISQCVITKEKGVTFFKDKNTGKIIAKASPNTIRGTNFVYVYGKNNSEPTKKVAISYLGEVYEFPTLHIKDFWNNFQRAVKIDMDRKRPQK